MAKQVAASQSCDTVEGANGFCWMLAFLVGLFVFLVRGIVVYILCIVDAGKPEEDND
jgi:hypothetical protein